MVDCSLRVPANPSSIQREVANEAGKRRDTLKKLLYLPFSSHFHYRDDYCRPAILSLDQIGLVLRGFRVERFNLFPGLVDKRGNDDRFFFAITLTRF